MSALRAALLLALLAAAAPGQSAAPAARTTGSTLPMDLTDEWRAKDAVLELVQAGDTIRATFAHVAPNGYAVEPGDLAFTGTLKGNALEGTLHSRGLYRECPRLTREGPLRLTLDQTRERLEGSGVVRSYWVEGCRDAGTERRLSLELVRRACFRLRRRAEEARQALAAARAQGDPTALESASAEVQRAERALAECVEEEGLCADWRERFEEMRRVFREERLEGYQKAAKALDDAYVAWMKGTGEAAREVTAYSQSYVIEYASLVNLEKFRDPKWIQDMVQTTAKAEMAAGVILLAKGLLSAAGKRVSKETLDAGKEALEEAAKKVRARFPRLPKVAGWVSRPAKGAYDWYKAADAQFQFWLRNTAYFGYLRRKVTAKMLFSKARLNQLDAERWQAFHDSVRTIAEEWPDQVTLAFTGSTSKVAKSYMKSGRLPGPKALEELSKDYAGLGSDIDFQFIIKNPEGVDDLAAFYARQEKVVKRFNELFTQKMGFHPDLVDVKLFPSPPWWSRRRAKGWDQGLDDLREDLEYLTRNSRDPEFYLTPGNRKMKELMDEAGDAVFDLSKTGKASKLDAEQMKRIYGEVEFHPGDGLSVVEEQLIFAEKYLKKLKKGDLDHATAARKYSKYYLRGAFGKLLTQPGAGAKVRKLMKAEDLDLQSATYELMRREYSHLFSPRQLDTVKLALDLKSARKPKKILDDLRKARGGGLDLFGKKRRKLAEEFLDRARKDFVQWHGDARKASESYWKDRLAGATGEARKGLQAQRDAYSHSRTFSQTRMADNEALLKELGLSDQKIRQVRAARDAAERAAKARAGPTTVDPGFESFSIGAGSALVPPPPPTGEDDGVVTEAAKKTAGLVLEPFTKLAEGVGMLARWYNESLSEEEHARVRGRLQEHADKAREAMVQLWKLNDQDHPASDLPDLPAVRKAFRRLHDEGQAPRRGVRGAPYGSRLYQEFLHVIASARTPEERECLLELKEEWDRFRDLQEELMGEIRERHDPALARADLAWDIALELGPRAYTHYTADLKYVVRDALDNPLSVAILRSSQQLGEEVLVKLGALERRR